MIGIIDDTGKIVAYDYKENVDEVGYEELGFQRTDDDVDRVYEVIGMHGVTLEMKDDFSDALREFRNNDQAVFMTATEA